MSEGVSWSSQTLSRITQKLSVDFKKGLSDEEVLARQKRDGKNTFSSEKGSRFFSLVAKQLKNPLVLILFIAGTVTFFLSAYVDTIVIAIALIINIAVDLFQRGRASRAFQKLKSSQKKYAVALRGERKVTLPAQELVRGDIIFLNAGAAVPADARLISCNSFRVNEATLTGEWIDVEKDASKEIKSTTISEQVNMVWMGTLVSNGEATAVVVETGEGTQLGSIAESLKGVEEEDTPLQRTIRKLGHFIAFIILAVIAFLTLFGIVAGNPVGEMLLLAVAVAVAAIPEGLPAAVTVVLALGMERILSKKGLVRNLLAAETLGSTTIILTDKTGTLTKATMQLRSVATKAHVDEAREENLGNSLTLFDEDERHVLSMAVRASDAFIEKEKDERTGLPSVSGRPIEKAIVEAGIFSGINQEALLSRAPQIAFKPFSSAEAHSISVHKKGESIELVVVGAPEKVLEQSKEILVEGKMFPLGVDERKKLVSFQERLSADGARLVAVGFTEKKNSGLSEKKLKEYIQEGIVFGGFLVFDDPIRKDVPLSIKTAQESGIRIVMITGDHPATALRIASQVGITRGNNKVLTGAEIEALSDKALLYEISKTNVFARVAPQQKLRMVRLLKGQGEVVAMTGDGINDAPALRNADIGISLESGTDVAKEAADLILLGNGFAIIISAIEEGRRIIDNLKKITAYLLSTGFSEIALVGGALLISAPLPLLPAQILWVNIVSEGFMNFAFAFEPKERDIMKRNPKIVKSTIITPELKRLIIIIGTVSGAFLITLYLALSQFSLAIEEIRTVMFVALSAVSIFFSFSLKNIHEPIWKIPLFSNRYLLGALGMSFLFLFGALLLPPLQQLLSLEALPLPLLALSVAFGLLNLILIEITKYFVFRRSV